MGCCEAKKIIAFAKFIINKEKNMNVHEQSITKSKELFNFMLDEFYNLVHTDYFYDKTPRVITKTRVKYNTDKCKLTLRYMGRDVLGATLSMPLSIGDNNYKWLLNVSGKFMFSQLLSIRHDINTEHLPKVSVEDDHIMITAPWEKMKFPTESIGVDELLDVLTNMLTDVLASVKR